uniref:Protein spaetzle n=1 Tax=Rhabditophanes sp. KR3021 TaxID=114890 RepID=A0AC35UH28_9BILA
MEQSKLLPEVNKRNELTTKTLTSPPTTTTTKTPVSDHLFQITDEIGQKNENNSEDCDNFGDVELFQLLDKVGGINQQMAANSIHDAARRFTELVPDAKSADKSAAKAEIFKTNEASDVNMMKASIIPFGIMNAASAPMEGSGGADDSTFAVDLQSTNVFNPQPYGPDCNEDCIRLTNILTEATASSKTNKRKKRFANVTETAFPDENKTDIFTPIQTIYIGKGINKCVPRGTDLDDYGEFKSLCSSCSVIYLMSEKMFPRYFNGVKCDEKDSQCIFDKNIKQFYGKCGPQTISYKVMVNEGTEKCKKFKYKTIMLPIACDCRIRSSALFLSA